MPGDASRTGFTSTYHGPYRLLALTGMLAEEADRDEYGVWQHRARIGYTGREACNFVPVDWVADVIVASLADPATFGRPGEPVVYHLTSPDPLTSFEFNEAMGEHFRYEGIEFVPGFDAANDPSATDTERMFAEYMGQYLSYMWAKPTFDQANVADRFPELPCPLVDSELVHKMLRFAEADNWGRKRRAAVAK